MLAEVHLNRNKENLLVSFYRHGISIPLQPSLQKKIIYRHFLLRHKHENIKKGEGKCLKEKYRWLMSCIYLNKKVSFPHATTEKIQSNTCFFSANSFCIVKENCQYPGKGKKQIKQRRNTLEAHLIFQSKQITLTNMLIPKKLNTFSVTKSNTSNILEHKHDYNDIKRPAFLFWRHQR